MEEKSKLPVEAWVESASNLSSKVDKIDDSGTALQLCEACIALLKSLSPFLSQNFQDKAGLVAFQEIVVKLQLWRDGFGPGELEMVLTRSKTIQASVLRHLIAISNLLRCNALISLKTLSNESQVKMQMQEMEKLIEQAMIIIMSDDDNDSEEESEDELSSSIQHGTHTKMADLLKDAQHYISLLMNLLPSLHHFLEYMRKEKVEKGVAEDDFANSHVSSAYINIVREKFKHAEDDIVKRLGEANWQRHLDIRKKLEKNMKEDSKEEVEVVTTKSLFRPISTFQDSGLGTSIATPNVAVVAIVAAEGSVASHSSFRTSATEGGPGSLRVPETPSEVYLDLPFKCQICGEMIHNVKTRYQWKIHVFADLEAYICTFQDCQYSLATFPSRELWATHEFSTHRTAKVWACSECDSEFLAAHDLAQHMQTQYRRTYSNTDLEIILRAAERVQDRQCPLCLKTTNGKQKDFAAHVGKHMEAIALTALPKEPESDAENDSNPTLDQESDEEISIALADQLVSPPLSPDEDENDQKCGLCQDGPYGDMIFCENAKCPYLWFHWRCVGIESEPEGKWFCPICQSRGFNKHQQAHLDIATQSTQTSENAGVLENNEKQEVRCSQCSHPPFKDSFSLREHIAAAHSRPFACIFAFAGCTSTFESIYKWEQHTDCEHFSPEYYSCVLCRETIVEGTTSRKKPELMGKETFKKHFRRLHAHSTIDGGIIKDESKAQLEREALQASYSGIRRLLLDIPCPQLTCPGIFNNVDGWSDWIEHVDQHMKKGEVTALAPGKAFVSWALDQKIIEPTDDGAYELTSLRDAGLE